MLAVVTSPCGLVTILLDEVTLSQKLRTPPLPVTHVLVGYQWQYIGLCPVKNRHNSYSSDLVSHLRVYPNTTVNPGAGDTEKVSEFKHGKMICHSDVVTRIGTLPTVGEPQMQNSIS